jgi:hypothetical protein
MQTLHWFEYQVGQLVTVGMFLCLIAGLVYLVAMCWGMVLRRSYLAVVNTYWFMVFRRIQGIGMARKEARLKRRSECTSGFKR